MVLPNFFIIGAARSATSSLYFYLREHPEIYMSPDKEAQFFGFYETKRAHKSKYQSMEEYGRLFDDITDEKIVGEATPTYLALEDSAYSIKKYCPDAKLLASLRNPIDRAFSYYEMSISKGHDKKQTFEQWMDGNEFWLSQGRYFSQLTRYIDLFGKDKLMLVLFEDVKNNTADVIANIHKFLEIEVIKPEKTPAAYNRGGKPKGVVGAFIYKATTNRTLNRLLRPFIPRWGVNMVHALRNKAVKPSEMNAETRQKLIEYFRDDILKTQELIGRDLGHWLK
ncbi:MAG: hypothetical protein COA54_01235 [Thiotrichaceae bacterium]|nr:MAG: hypothetical protein COA54_01235 [Thiotrichaceae bacterium]